MFKNRAGEKKRSFLQQTGYVGEEGRRANEFRNFHPQNEWTRTEIYHPRGVSGSTARAEPKSGEKEDLPPLDPVA